jgi:hypothetical protein
MGKDDKKVNFNIVAAQAAFVCFESSSSYPPNQSVSILLFLSLSLPDSLAFSLSLCMPHYKYNGRAPNANTKVDSSILSAI